jgi:hypothetical protein
VFWLNAYGNDDANASMNAEQREALRQDQIRDFAIRTGIQTESLKPGEIETSFWRPSKSGENGVFGSLTICPLD